MNSSKLTILSGGAAQGLVAALAAQFKAESGCEIDGTFGAVGAMRDKLLSGTPADLLILTRALIDELAAQGHVVPGSVANIGTVLTAVAVRSGDPSPDVGDAAGLRAALLAADAIYFPDPKLATAGIHFAKVIERLGHRGRRCFAHQDLSQRRHGHARAGCCDRATPDRLHAGDGDPQHARCPARGAPAGGVRAGDRLHRRRLHARRLAATGARTGGAACRRARARARGACKTCRLSR